MSAIRLPAEVSAALDDLTAAVTAIDKLDLDQLAAPLRLQVLEHMEKSRRLQLAISHDVIGGLAKQDPAEAGGPVHKVIADWMRISPTDARRRIKDVEQLSPRLTLTGQQLPAELPATAKAWRDGLLGGAHLRVIQTSCVTCPEKHRSMSSRTPSGFWPTRPPSCAPTNSKRPRTAPRC